MLFDLSISWESNKHLHRSHPQFRYHWESFWAFASTRRDIQQLSLIIRTNFRLDAVVNTNLRRRFVSLPIWQSLKLLWDSWNFLSESSTLQWMEERLFIYSRSYKTYFYLFSNYQSRQMTMFSYQIRTSDKNGNQFANRTFIYAILLSFIIIIVRACKKYKRKRHFT